jgi:two-component sensor histidine kinase
VPEGFLLEVADDGVGLPDNFDLEETNSLGLLIVQTLTMQLKGSLEIEQDNGAAFKLVFSDE